jgi:hypothetical protein
MTSAPCRKSVLEVLERGWVEDGVFKNRDVLGHAPGRITVQLSPAGLPSKMKGELAGRKFKAQNFRAVAHAL